MRHLHIELEDWQGAALAELARARGIGVEEMARCLLTDRLVERLHTAFDDLLGAPPMRCGYPGLAAPMIEHRLKQLFEE